MSGSHGSTIMVCGIAGVGKTHLIHAALGRLPSGLTWRASEIIGEARKTRDPERLRALPADEIRRSQELLVDGFEARRRALPDNLVLLDAHSVIDSDDGLFEIPVDIVARLEPAGIVHISDDIERIQLRRLSDRERARPTRTQGQLQAYQARSVKVCEGYQAALGIPLVQIRSGEDLAFVKAIEEIVRARLPTAGKDLK